MKKIKLLTHIYFSLVKNNKKYSTNYTYEKYINNNIIERNKSSQYTCRWYLKSYTYLRLFAVIQL